MVMCSRCHKRVATVFVTKVENGERKTEGLCMKCATELGMPADQMMGNVMGKLGISPEMLENMEEELHGLIAQSGGLPSDSDDNEDGGAPAIDFPKIFRESGLFGTPGAKNSEGEKGTAKEKAPKEKKHKFLDTYCRNLTRRARDGKLDRIVGRERELARVILLAESSRNRS